MYVRSQRTVMSAVDLLLFCGVFVAARFAGAQSESLPEQSCPESDNCKIMEPVRVPDLKRITLNETQPCIRIVKMEVIDGATFETMWMSSGSCDWTVNGDQLSTVIVKQNETSITIDPSLNKNTTWMAVQCSIAEMTNYICILKVVHVPPSHPPSGSPTIQASPSKGLPSMSPGRLPPTPSESPSSAPDYETAVVAVVVAVIVAGVLIFFILLYACRAKNRRQCMQQCRSNEPNNDEGGGGPIEGSHTFTNEADVSSTTLSSNPSSGGLPTSRNQANNTNEEEELMPTSENEISFLVMIMEAVEQVMRYLLVLYFVVQDVIEAMRVRQENGEDRLCERDSYEEAKVETGSKEGKVITLNIAIPVGWHAVMESQERQEKPSLDCIEHTTSFAESVIAHPCGSELNGVMECTDESTLGPLEERVLFPVDFHMEQSGTTANTYSINPPEHYTLYSGKGVHVYTDVECNDSELSSESTGDVCSVHRESTPLSENFTGSWIELMPAMESMSVTLPVSTIDEVIVATEPTSATYTLEPLNVMEPVAATEPTSPAHGVVVGMQMEVDYEDGEFTTSSKNSRFSRSKCRKRRDGRSPGIHTTKSFSPAYQLYTSTKSNWKLFRRNVEVVA